MENHGIITQVMGPVVDVEFAEELPKIHDSLIVARSGDERLVLEVQQHLGGNMIRAVAMSSTDGLARGMKATDARKPISMPVGKATLGRMFNVLGEPIDGKGELGAHETSPFIARRQSFPSNPLRQKFLKPALKLWI